MPLLEALPAAAKAWQQAAKLSGRNREGAIPPHCMLFGQPLAAVGKKMESVIRGEGPSRPGAPPERFLTQISAYEDDDYGRTLRAVAYSSFARSTMQQKDFLMFARFYHDCSRVGGKGIFLLFVTCGLGIITNVRHERR